MQEHTKIFQDFWWDELTLSQTEQCSVCNSWEGTDIHHISSRGLGSSKYKNFLENLICLCRSCHLRCHSDKNFNKKARIINLRLIADKLESELDES